MSPAYPEGTVHPLAMRPPDSFKPDPAHDTDEQPPQSVGWDLAEWCRVTFVDDAGDGHLSVVVSQRQDVTVRRVAIDDLRDFAVDLLWLTSPHGGPPPAAPAAPACSVCGRRFAAAAARGRMPRHKLPDYSAWCAGSLETT